MEANNNMLDVWEAAVILAISPHTVRKWVRDGKLAYYKVGKRVLFRYGDLNDFMEACLVPALDSPPPAK